MANVVLDLEYLNVPTNAPDIEAAKKKMVDLRKDLFIAEKEMAEAEAKAAAKAEAAAVVAKAIEAEEAAEVTYEHSSSSSTPPKIPNAEEIEELLKQFHQRRKAGSEIDNLLPPPNFQNNQIIWAQDLKWGKEFVEAVLLGTLYDNHAVVQWKGDFNATVGIVDSIA